MSKSQHRKLPDHLPDHWALLCGRNPGSSGAFRSEHLQIIYNHAHTPWKDETAHEHTGSDEIYIVLEGAMHIAVEGTISIVAAGEYLCVASGTTHRLVHVSVPHRSFVIRGPSLNDKQLKHAASPDSDGSWGNESSSENRDA
jgi:mannose-6-phosphate isomerase-like protein (cupin superfamily)